MRVTQHNGRSGKDGVFNPKHNDRNFDVENARHINQEKVKLNSYWCIYGDMTFEQAEQKYYQENFSQALEKKNEKHKQNRQYDRIRTSEDIRKAKNTCPEEQILQIGKYDDKFNPAIAKEIIEKQLQWEMKTFPNVVMLDVALHLDEITPHVHVRKVWVATDENGDKIVNQTKALQEMGIKIDGKKTRYNNPKKIYTMLCRKHFENLCRSYGIKIEEERLQGSKEHLDTVSYKVNQERQRLKNIEKKIDVALSFSVGDNVKNGNRIRSLQAKVERYEKFLRDNGINPAEVLKAYSKNKDNSKTR